jgi:hypothetical protein
MDVTLEEPVSVKVSKTNSVNILVPMVLLTAVTQVLQSDWGDGCSGWLDCSSYL